MFKNYIRKVYRPSVRHSFYLYCLALGQVLDAIVIVCSFGFYVGGFAVKVAGWDAKRKIEQMKRIRDKDFYR